MLASLHLSSTASNDSEESSSDDSESSGNGSAYMGAGGTVCNHCGRGEAKGWLIACDDTCER